MAQRGLCLIWMLLAVCSFLAHPVFAKPEYESKTFIFEIIPYFRIDSVNYKNVVDLDDNNSADTTSYLAIDYSLAFKAEWKNNGPIVYLKFERNGPWDYGAPVFVHNTLVNSGGHIDSYRDQQLLPQLEEFWLDLPLGDGRRFKTGAYTYKVGNAFALNGGYENLGAMLTNQSEKFAWRLYYCRPDILNKIKFGPDIPQDKEQGFDYEHSTANFFAFDLSIENCGHKFNPYIGALIDYTSPGKRSSSFSASVDEEYLGTGGISWDWKGKDLSLSLEAAGNFGEARSRSEYKDIQHSGYLAYAATEYNIGRFNPGLQVLACSGNKVTPEMAENAEVTLSGSKNRAFSYYSPSNSNLSDAISSSNVEMLPIVAMGGGYGLNYGVPRPGTFASADFENLIMPCAGFAFDITNKLNIGLWLYYLMAFEKGVGTLNGKGKYLNRELGYEANLFIDYKIREGIVLSLLGGYILPGKYHKELRDDTDGSLFSPYVRGDGKADAAYQIEAALEMEF